MDADLRSSRSGFALVAVLAILFILASLISAVTLLTRAGIDSARFADDDVVDDALVRAGLELAAFQLFQASANPLDVNGQQIRLDAGTVTLTVIGESGKIDLNASEPTLLSGAFRAAGLKTMSPDDFAARVVDWRDNDEDVSEGGGESGEYSAAGLRYRPQNDTFRNVDELQFLLGMKPEDVAKLRPYFTVFNPQGTINLYDAPPLVLKSLPGMTDALVKRVLQMRKDRSQASQEAMLALLADQQAWLSSDPAVAYRVSVEARREGRPARKVSTVLIPDPSGREAYRTVDWNE